jgi:hypothetical protein
MRNFAPASCPAVRCGPARRLPGDAGPRFSFDQMNYRAVADRLRVEVGKVVDEREPKGLPLSG